MDMQKRHEESVSIHACKRSIASLSRMGQYNRTSERRSSLLVAEHQCLIREATAARVRQDDAEIADGWGAVEATCSLPMESSGGEVRSELFGEAVLDWNRSWVGNAPATLACGEQEAV